MLFDRSKKTLQKENTVLAVDFSVKLIPRSQRTRLFAGSSALVPLSLASLQHYRQESFCSDFHNDLAPPHMKVNVVRDHEPGQSLVELFVRSGIPLTWRVTKFLGGFRGPVFWKKSCSCLSTAEMHCVLG